MYPLPYPLMTIFIFLRGQFAKPPPCFLFPRSLQLLSPVFYLILGLTSFFYLKIFSVISCGQKNISVYKKDSSYPISTTRVAVVTVKALLQNLIDNMESALGVSSNIMEIDEETIDKRLTSESISTICNITHKHTHHTFTHHNLADVKLKK